eukprot:g4102.t1
MGSCTTVSDAMLPPGIAAMHAGADTPAAPVGLNCSVAQAQACGVATARRRLGGGAGAVLGTGAGARLVVPAL